MPESRRVPPKPWTTTLLAVLATVSFATPAWAGHGEADIQENATHLANVAQTGPTNSDLAFWGDHLYAGNYDGFKIIDVSDRTAPETLVEYPCVSIQNDVGVWDTGPAHGAKRLLFTSVDAVEPNDDCVDASGARDPVSPISGSGESAGFEGIRIFDVTNPQSPTYLKAVFTDCGSHTHTVVPVRHTGGSGADRQFVLDAETPDRVFIYVSSYPLLSPLDPTRCGVSNADGSVTHNKISIVEVPFSDPTEADVLKEVPLHPTTLGFPGQESQGCHDIGVFIELGIAAGACQGEGQIWDISDPANPDTMNAQRIFNEEVNYFHSATFTWDGRYVIFGDEEGGAAITHACLNASTGQGGTGATWFYEREALEPSDLPGPQTEEAGSFTQTRQQFTEGATICTAHNYNVIPVSDRYLLTSAYYEAGTSVLDFTDLENVEEIAYYDAEGGDVNPGATEENPKSDTWSSYWYRGNAFGNDINRGVDVFGLTGEPASLVAGARNLDRMNPQTQECLILGPEDNGTDCEAATPEGPPASGGDDGGGGEGGPEDPGKPPCTALVRGEKTADDLEGSAGSERILGKGGGDRIEGRGGADCIRGGGGRDNLKGGGGDDELRPGRGADTVQAGPGDDIVNTARGGPDRIGCGPGEDVAVVNRSQDRSSRSCETTIERNRFTYATAAHLKSH